MIGTLLGGIGSLYANKKAGKVSDEATSAYNMAMQQLLAKQQGMVDTHLAPELYADHMQSSDVQSTLAQVREQIQQQQQAVQGGITSRGGTAEAAMAYTGQANKQYGDIINRLYSHASGYRKDARERYLQGLQGLMGMQDRIAMQNYNQGQQKADNWMTWGTNAVTAGMGIDKAMNESAAQIIKMIAGGGVGV
jgi:hypothetical protein